VNVDPDQIAAELRQLVGRTYGLPPEALRTLEEPTALYGSGLGLDSLDSMPLVIAIEDHFGIRLQNDAATRKAFSSFGALVRHVTSLLAARSAS
jgi:acyl carrier protein